jgi:hypothetical protein
MIAQTASVAVDRGGVEPAHFSGDVLSSPQVGAAAVPRQAGRAATPHHAPAADAAVPAEELA